MSLALHPLHDLVVRLRRGDYAEEEFAVAADHCEELGFAQLAAALRAPNECFERRQAVWTLSVMVGVESTMFNRYDVIVGLPVFALGACEIETVDVRPARRSFRLRRLVLAPNSRDRIALTGLRVGDRVGDRKVLENADPVPSVLFTENGFDTFDELVNAGEVIFATFESLHVREVEIHGCFLGSAV